MTRPDGPNETRTAAEDHSSERAGADKVIVHASCVAVGERGVLIRGRSGSGKSSLALDLMALGAVLVSDDRVLVSRGRQGLIAGAPTPIRGLIEARGVGLLRADTRAEVKISLMVDLDRAETARLPEIHRTELLGQSVVLIYRPDNPHFPAAILQYLKAGRLGEDV